MFDAITSLDASVLIWIDALPHPPTLTLVMGALSAVSDSALIWSMLALMLALRGNPDAALRVVLALVVTSVVVGAVLKPAIGRSRPSETHSIVLYGAIPDSPSFPSGHAAGAGAGAYSLSRAWFQRRSWLWALAIAVALSRIYLGMHYPLDTVAGLCVGAACAFFVTGGRMGRPAPTPGV